MDRPAPAERLRALRLAGRLGDALREATRAMAAAPADTALMAEAVQVLILTEQTDTAVRLYQAFSDKAGDDENLEPAALVRLALQMERTDLLEGMPVPESPAWLAPLLTAGEDPRQPLRLDGMQVRVANGPSAYVFSGGCPHCGHRLDRQVNTNLLVRQEGLCPACFGSWSLDYRDIAGFLRARYPEYLARDVSETDWDLIDHIRPRLMEPGGAPDIVQALGQQYHFLLNEVLARHLLAADRNGPDRPEVQP